MVNFGVGTFYHWISSVLLVQMVLASTVLSQSSSDECDWTGSGLERRESGRGVLPVYLRCAQGKVQWLYPRGGLRVILKMGTSGKDFVGCVRASREFQGARMYVEGHKSLHLLYAPKDGKHPDLMRCFESYHGQVALYIEAEPVTDDLRKDVAEFSYDLKQLTSIAEGFTEPDEECRPCTENELLRLFCVSDFVASGSISGVSHNPALERSEVIIRAKRVIRDTNSVFSEREVEEDDPGKFGRIHVPINCGVRYGTGDFLFVGRIKLGNPTLSCAPRLEDWERIRLSSLSENSNQCQLD